MNTTGKKSSYAAKKQQMINGSYHGTSPFYENIPEFQHLKPLSMYAHLKVGGFRIPDNRGGRSGGGNFSLMSKE